MGGGVAVTRALSLHWVKVQQNRTILASAPLKLGLFRDMPEQRAPCCKKKPLYSCHIYVQPSPLVALNISVSVSLAHGFPDIIHVGLDASHVR